MQIPSMQRAPLAYLTLFGYLWEVVYAGTVPVNSNSIKNLPGVFGSKGADTVSPSPRTSPSGGTGHRSADTLQVVSYPRAHNSMLCEEVVTNLRIFARDFPPLP